MTVYICRGKRGDRALWKMEEDKTADPLGMFPLANWISMTDLHFHMDRESRGGESHGEIVTGKLIFERDPTSDSEGWTTRILLVSTVLTTKSRPRIRSYDTRKTCVFFFLLMAQFYAVDFFFLLTSQFYAVRDRWRSTCRNFSFELLRSAAPSKISIRTGCTVQLLLSTLPPTIIVWLGTD